MALAMALAMAMVMAIAMAPVMAPALAVVMALAMAMAMALALAIALGMAMVMAPALAIVMALGMALAAALALALTMAPAKKINKDNKMNEIEINGEIYIKKSAMTSEVISEYVIVRTYSAGVFAGEILSRDKDYIVMKNARRLWYWSGASSLSQLAIDGVAKPEECKFPVEVDRVELFNVIEIINTTEKARKSIADVKIWAQ